MDELWKDVESTSGNYQISSLGNARKRINGEYSMLKPHHDKFGYQQVTVKFDDGRTKYVAVHRLVATAFISNPYNLPIVHHIDDNKENNTISNLFWCTRAQNNSFYISSRQGLFIDSRVIKKYSLTGEYIATYSSFADAGKSVGKNKTSLISKCCNNIEGRKSAYGYKWAFGKGDKMYKAPVDKIDSNHVSLFIDAYSKNPQEVVKALNTILKMSE